MSEQERDTLFCLRIFTNLSLGGVWVVPRSGLIFEKVALDPPTMSLVEIADTSSLRDFVTQLQDFALIKAKFAEAGITITVKAEEDAGEEG